MKKIWKKRAVVATVLLFVCAAVYMNWRYAGSLEDTSKVLGESTLVSGEKTGENSAGAEQLASENDYFATLIRSEGRPVSACTVSVMASRTALLSAP